MSKYVFTVPSYKAINSASIVNEGITLIAGENGSGKSTLSRMLYYTVNIMSDFSDFVFRETLSNVFAIVRPLRDALMQVTNQTQNRILIREKYNMLEGSSSYEELNANFNSMLNEYEPILLNFFSTVKELKKQERILDFLGVEASGRPDELARACIDLIRSQVEKCIITAHENIDKHPKALLVDYIRSYGLDLQDYPAKGVKFSEDDVDLLISKYFSAPLSLHRAIYIDTPMAVNDNFNYSTRYWNNLNGLLNHETVDGTMEEAILHRKISGILHGDILMEKDKFNSHTKLCYKRYDGLEIDLVNAATGFKSFAYLLRLLAVGFLKSDTLLLIDEPEAHLHPQWIVEFANILVQLNKKLGVKIIITSHNPDMVSAIRAISESEGVLERTRFYLAKCNEQNIFKYDYIDLGSEIGPIFESFNIALNRIEYYGTRSSSI